MDNRKCQLVIHKYYIIDNYMYMQVRNGGLMSIIYFTATLAAMTLS